ncbi:hypothetical protein Dda_6772 [Drechslerella dactyloides]|uniref:Uncharacterized protein n=1 Tax=Drechslerella dactyloides TaxID=74499 RepID=A0AAD6IY26_DREDA|nr:hypothetical protein Dda_6772 [Drechslerella dactyloides]
MRIQLGKTSLSESFKGANITGASPTLAEKHTFASLTGSLTDSQRAHLREARAEEIFDQNTPFSTIRLMLARAAECPDAPTPTHLFQQILDYFGSDDDQMLALLQSQKLKQQRPKLHSRENDLSDPSVVSKSSIDINRTIASEGKSLASGTCTPSSGEPQLSNAEIMVYLSTMFGDIKSLVPGMDGTPNGLRDDESLGYVSDCEPCDYESSVDGSDIASAQKESKKDEAREEDPDITPRQARRDIDEDYDMDK